MRIAWIALALIAMPAGTAGACEHDHLVGFDDHVLVSELGGNTWYLDGEIIGAEAVGPRNPNALLRTRVEVHPKNGVVEQLVVHMWGCGKRAGIIYIGTPEHGGTDVPVPANYRSKFATPEGADTKWSRDGKREIDKLATAICIVREWRIQVYGPPG